jgi:A1 cistron-splicing factor AAR2
MLGSGTLGIVGLPVGYNFGIDLRMWQIGDRFTGIRGIPSGVHFVSYSPPDDEIRQGFFVTVTQTSPMFIMAWDPQIESLVHLEHSDRYDHIRDQFLNDFRLISGLAPFDTCLSQEIIQDWKTATEFITPELIDKLQPINGHHFHSRTQASGELAESCIPTIFFTDLSKTKPSGNVTSSDLTRHHIDRSAQLAQFISASHSINPNDLVGELQAAFILFLVGFNYDAFIQWRKLTELLLGCREGGILNHTDLFTSVARALHFQLKQMPGDFLFDAGITDDDIPHRKHERNVFILPLISQFVIACSDDSLINEHELQRAVQELDKLMADKYGEEWTSIFNPEEGDDPPAIVHL